MIVDLFARSNFSFLRGASHPEEMVEAAVALGYAALGIADLDGVYGSAKAHVRAKELAAGGEGADGVGNANGDGGAQGAPPHREGSRPPPPPPGPPI
jgi:hypothetical protein